MSELAPDNNMVSYQASLVRLCLSAEPDDQQEFFGSAYASWLTYRSLVRGRLQETIYHAFERFCSRFGKDNFQEAINLFLDNLGPRSPLIRDLPGEFLGCLRSSKAAELSEKLTPPLLDLALFEWAELEVAYAKDDPPLAFEPLSFDRVVLLSNAYRLLHVSASVHRISAEDPFEEIELIPQWICVYRDKETYETRVLELTHVTGVFLSLLREENQTLLACVREAAGATQATLDDAWLHALTGVLADWFERGILLGCRAGAADQHVPVAFSNKEG